MAMNIFRLTGDLCHIISIAIFVHVICWKKNASGTFRCLYRQKTTSDHLIYVGTLFCKCANTFPLTSTFFEFILHNRRFDQVASLIHNCIHRPLLGFVHSLY